MTDPASPHGAARRPSDDTPVPLAAYQTETTSRGFTVALVYIMMLSFLLTVVLVYRYHP